MHLIVLRIGVQKTALDRGERSKGGINETYFRWAFKYIIRASGNRVNYSGGDKSVEERNPNVGEIIKFWDSIKRIIHIKM